MSHHPAHSPSPHDETLAAATEKAVEIGQEIEAAASAKFEQVVHGAQDQIKAYSKDLWKEIQDSRVLRDAIEYTKTKPLHALLFSLGLGILIGRGMRR